MPLSPPPRDANGNVLPHDHTEIGPTDGVIRRISRYHLQPVGDGTMRVTSLAFEPSSGLNGGVSVDLEGEIIRAGLDVVAYVTRPEFLGSVRFEASALRQEGLQVGYDPLPPDQPHHGEIWGNMTKGKKRRLIAIARWFVQVPDVTL